MKIGIDISQVVYGTGVGNFVTQLVTHLIETDSHNEYILFGSSLRQRNRYASLQAQCKAKKNVSFKIFPFPPSFLDFLWNRLHIFPIEYFIGDIDVFISSDWTQPPTRRAKRVSIIYDMIVYTYPNETAERIVSVQKRKLEWVRREIDSVICISESTKRDVMRILRLPENKLHVVYPGF